MARNKQAISGRTRVLFSGELTQPDNSKYTILLDTTQDIPNEHEAAGGKSAAVPTVGARRGQALGRQYGIAISCTGQNCTVLQYHLHADGAWHLFRSTTVTAAADPQSFAWDPSAYGATDALALVQAGATAPTKIYADLTERTLP